MKLFESIRSISDSIPSSQDTAHLESILDEAKREGAELSQRRHVDPHEKSGPARREELARMALAATVSVNPGKMQDIQREAMGQPTTSEMPIVNLPDAAAPLPESHPVAEQDNIHQIA